MSVTDVEKQDTVHVVLAVHDDSGTYARHAGVVMLSLFEHTGAPVCVHILHDETLTSENRQKLQAIAAKYDQRTDFIDAGSTSAKLGEEALALVASSWSIGSLFRLLIPELLPSLEKAIYLDCDTVVNTDIQKLWNQPLDDCSLAGVPDHSKKKSNRRLSRETLRTRLIGCSLPTYVNSGVLVMRLDRIRAKYNMVREAVRWFSENASMSTLPDQDFLNALFRGDIKLIENRFNNRDIDGDVGDSIMHAIRDPKPWKGLRGTPLEKLYWKTYLRTPWGAELTPGETAELLIDLMGASPQNHRHTSQCYRRIGERFRRDVLCNDIFSTIGLLVKEALRRLSRRLRRSEPESEKAGAR